MATPSLVSVHFKPWQWLVLVAPLVLIGGFLLFCAGWQIHQLGLNWVWGAIALIMVGWRWLLVRWTKPIHQFQETLADWESVVSLGASDGDQTPEALAALIQGELDKAQGDPPIWEDWAQFWTRCQDLVRAIAHHYYPEVKYPLLNIHIPQAYGLIRGTVDDTDRWMAKLSPLLGQVTIGQAYQGYEMYRQLEPAARRVWKLLGWSQWIFNPVTAVVKRLSQESQTQAQEELLGNLSDIFREAALRNLANQALKLYGGDHLSPALLTPRSAASTFPQTHTQTIREIIETAQPATQLQEKPLQVLVIGRTGAGKSSLINTLFQRDLAAVDVLPRTDGLHTYHWHSDEGEALTLWDTPGFEQVGRDDFRELILHRSEQADLIFLVTPAPDPALALDLEILNQIHRKSLPLLVVMTQVDRLRPFREWAPPYDWHHGDRPKEQAIREAVGYRQDIFAPYNLPVFPLVTRQPHRHSWGLTALTQAIANHLDPAAEMRLARFYQDQDIKIQGAAALIDRYTKQMATSQGLTALLKSPVLQFLSTLTTGSPGLAYLLAEQIPVEQLPVVVGKLQMAYDLFLLVGVDPHDGRSAKTQFELLKIWPLLLDSGDSPEKQAYAWGHALLCYWTQSLSVAELKTHFQRYLSTQ